jgi:RNA polymerase sigma-70 factor (ECF subfamily)
MAVTGEPGRDEAPQSAPRSVVKREAGGPSDAELVGRVLMRDDRHAFAEIVRRYQSLVRTLLRRLTCGDAALADDLAQESFLRAYRGLAGYRGQARLSSWLYRVAYNVFLAHNARARRELLSQPQLDDATQGTEGADDRTLLQHDMERAMAALSPPERAALTLAYRDGCSHAEVARVLGCPLGTAKSHILRGREKLERRLSAWTR